MGLRAGQNVLEKIEVSCLCQESKWSLSSLQPSHCTNYAILVPSKFLINMYSHLRMDSTVAGAGHGGLRR